MKLHPHLTRAQERDRCRRELDAASNAFEAAKREFRVAIRNFGRGSAESRRPWIAYRESCDRARAAARAAESRRLGAHFSLPSGDEPTPWDRCACGCGRPLVPNETGRPQRFYEAACRERAARRRGAGIPENAPPAVPGGRRTLTERLYPWSLMLERRLAFDWGRQSRRGPEWRLSHTRKE
jgi:hypothetical protein